MEMGVKAACLFTGMHGDTLYIYIQIASVYSLGLRKSTTAKQCIPGQPPILTSQLFLTHHF